MFLNTSDMDSEKLQDIAAKQSNAIPIGGLITGEWGFKCGF